MLALTVMKKVETHSIGSNSGDHNMLEKRL